MPGQTVQPFLSQAVAALERGRAQEALRPLSEALESRKLSRGDEMAVRALATEAWLAHGDLERAVEVLGRPPDVLREPLDAGTVSALWRLHGRLAMERGEQPRAIALLERALKQAQAAHDSRGIGLAHYELGRCYAQVGEADIVREHMTKAASALHAVGDRRHLALVHSRLGVTLAQAGRYDEATAAFHQAERLASSAQADDVLATICGNQANVATITHRHEQAVALAERSVTLHERSGSTRGLAISLATLGQICVRLGELSRAEQVLHRALEMRTPVQYREITGAVYDSLAQIHLVRGHYEEAEACLQQAVEAYGGYGTHASRWYEWSVRVLRAKLALRRGATDEALKRSGEIVDAGEAAPSDVRQAAGLLAAEALLAAGRLDELELQATQLEEQLDPHAAPGAWGELLRLRGHFHQRFGRTNEAYHDFAQSVSVFELIGDQHQAAVSRLALGTLLARAGARSTASRHLRDAIAAFESLGAAPDLARAREAADQVGRHETGEFVGSPAGADDAVARRLVNAAILPALLAREAVAAIHEACGADAVVMYVKPLGGDVRVVAAAGCDIDAGRVFARAAHQGTGYRGGLRIVEPLGRDPDGPRFIAAICSRPLGDLEARRLKMMATIARQGFDLCVARERSVALPDAQSERPLDPVLPGFICASPALSRVVGQIRRLQGNDLTVLITGESGTGKELVARAIHAGSARSASIFLPYNCTTTTRELADSQLFGHRRGSFTGAVADQPGVIRAATGGTIFLDEIGDLPLDVQPKLLRFLEQGEVMGVGDTRPQRVDVRVMAATNAELDQRVAEGKFREDLYYRLNVIRVHVPPLRDRREEVPLLSTMFLREACERLGKPGVRLGLETLSVFHEYRWPGNVRQLRNEIQRVVAMSAPSEVIGPQHLSPELTTGVEVGAQPEARDPAPVAFGPLSEAVDRLERDLIRSALDRSGGNISETARVLGLTRRGLYLKLKRLGLESRI